MGAELELEKLVIRIVTDTKGAFQGFNELEQRARVMAQNVQQAMSAAGGGGAGGGGGGGGGAGGGDDPFRRQRETLAANTLKMEARDREAAEKALDSQRQRAYEKQLRDDDALRNRQNAQRQRAYEQDQREQQRAVDSLGRQKQRAYEQDQRSQQQQQEKGYQQEFREYTRRERLLERAVGDREKKEQAGLDRETKRLTSEHDTRQRKLEQTLVAQEKEKQKRFEASNRLQERTDRESIRNTERAAKEKEKIERQSATDRDRQARESAAQRNEAARAAEARAQDRAAIAFGVGKTAAAISAPFVIGAKMSVDAFASFDLAMTESTSIMKVTEQETAKMRDLAKDLSTTGKQGPDELAKSFYFMASAGMNASQSMAALPQMQAFATAGAFDLALATSLANDSQKALGMSSRDATENLAGLIKVTDTLTKGAAMSNATVQQLAMSVSRTAGAAAKAFNRDIEEVVAVLGAFADQGVKGELAGNRYSMLLRHLGASSAKHAEQQKQLGFAIFEGGKMKDMGDILVNLERVLAPMSQEMKVAALQAMGFEARMQQAILPLIGMSGVVKEYEQTLRSAAGTTQDVAEKQMKAFANQIQMTANAVRVAAIEIGEMLAPAVAFVAGGVKEVVQWFRSLDKDAKTAIVAVTAFTVAALAGIAGIILGFQLINVLTGGFPIVVGLLVTGFAALGLAAGVVVAKMGGIGKVVEDLRYYAKKAWEWFQPLLPALESLWMTIKQVGSDALDALGKVALDTWNKISGGAEVDWNKVRDTVQDVILFIEYSLRNLGDTAELAWAGVKYYSIAALNYVLTNLGVILVGTATLNLFRTFNSNWNTMWQANADGTKSVLGTLLDNFVIFYQNVAAAAQGRFFDLQKFKNIVVGGAELSLRGVKIPELDRLQNEAEEEFDKLKDTSKKGFDEFKKEWEVERGIGRSIFQPLTDKLDELPPEFNKKGETTGEQFMQGLNKGLKKGDFVEVNTQADKAARRAYEDALGLGGRNALSDFVKIGKGAGSFKIPEDVRKLRDEADQKDNKDVLKRIANAAETQVKNAAKSLIVKIVRF